MLFLCSFQDAMILRKSHRRRNIGPIMSVVVKQLLHWESGNAGSFEGFTMIRALKCPRMMLDHLTMTSMRMGTSTVGGGRMRSQKHRSLRDC